MSFSGSLQGGSKLLDPSNWIRCVSGILCLELKPQVYRLIQVGIVMHKERGFQPRSMIFSQSETSLSINYLLHWGKLCVDCSICKFHSVANSHFLEPFQFGERFKLLLPMCHCLDLNLGIRFQVQNLQGTSDQKSL